MALQVSLPQSDYQALDTALLAACNAANLQPHPVFIEKIHQLYEMILVRHGLMLVGYSYGAKTSMYRMLATALGDLCEKGLLEENKWGRTLCVMICTCLNPAVKRCRLTAA